MLENQKPSIESVDWQAVESEAREFLQSRPTNPEQKEVVPHASIELQIDTAFLEEQQERAQSENEKIVWETMSALPSTIDFQPGVTIIIGKNGTGKTTLAKAVYISFLIEQQMEKSKEESAKVILDPKKSESEKNHALKIFKNPYAPAREEVLNARSKNQYLPGTLAATGGLAVELSKAIRTKSTTTKSHSIPDRYIDASSINGIFIQNAHEVYKEKLAPKEGIDSEGRAIFVKSTVSQEEANASLRARQAELGSTRQSIDQILQPFLHGQGGYQGPRVVFFDEIEVGADPFRKRKFNEWMQQFADGNDYEKDNPKSVIIAPTNSSALYENERVPRIDLRFPHKGIFLPKDMPGYYDIE